MVGDVQPWEVALSVGDPARRRSRSSRSSRPGCTRPASCCTASGRACGRSSRRRARAGLTGGRASASSSSGSRLISARTGAAAGRRAAGRHRPGLRARRGHVPGGGRDEPPQPAADARQVRAHAAGGPGCRRCPGRRPRRRAPGPRSRWPAPRRPRRPVAGPGAAPRAAGRAAGAAASGRRDAAGRRRGTRPAGPARRPAVPPAPRRSARPVGIDDDELAVEDRRARRDAHGHAGQLGECRGQVAPRRRPRSAPSPSPGRVGRPDQDERPDAAPPRLEQVLVRVERLRQRPRLASAAGPAGRAARSVSSRSESWSAIVARW